QVFDFRPLHRETHRLKDFHRNVTFEFLKRLENLERIVTRFIESLPVIPPAQNLLKKVISDAPVARIAHLFRVTPRELPIGHGSGMQGVAFVGGAVHAQDLRSFALSHWLNPPKQALPYETLAAVRAFAVYDNGDFIKASLSGFLNLDEAAQRANDGRRQVRA